MARAVSFPSTYPRLGLSFADSSGKIQVNVDIYFTAAGMIDLPTEKELEKLMQEYQKDHLEKGSSIKERAKASAS